MNCPNCGAQNPDEYRYCNKCGTSLREAPPKATTTEQLVNVRICPSCDQMSPSNSWHCYACGATLGVETIKEVKASDVHFPEKVSPSNTTFQTVKDDFIYGKDVRSSIPAPSRQQTEYDRGVGSSSQKEFFTGYGVLRGIASLCRTISNIVIVIAGIGALIFLFNIGNNWEISLGGIFLCAILGGYYYVNFRIIAEGVSVFLDIEMNTRRTAARTDNIEQLLKKLMAKGE